MVGLPWRSTGFIAISMSALITLMPGRQRSSNSSQWDGDWGGSCRLTFRRTDLSTMELLSLCALRIIQGGPCFGYVTLRSALGTSLLLWTRTAAHNIESWDWHRRGLWFRYALGSRPWRKSSTRAIWRLPPLYIWLRSTPNIRRLSMGSDSMFPLLHLAQLCTSLSSFLMHLAWIPARPSCQWRGQSARLLRQPASQQRPRSPP